MRGSGRSNIANEPGAGQIEVFYLFSLVLCRFAGKNTRSSPAGVQTCLRISAHLVGMPPQVHLQGCQGDFGRAPILAGAGRGEGRHEEMD